MSEEKIKELLDYLSSIGFPAPILEKEIRNHISINALEFVVRYDLQLEHKKMEYALHLLKDQQFQGYRLSSYRAVYTDENGYKSSRNFSPTAMGICNANLSYNIVSGRLDDLAEKLSLLKLEEFPGFPLIERLEEKLSGNSDHFELKCFRNEPDGWIEYTIPVSNRNDCYSVDTYKAVLIPYAPIDHGTYNGIDSRALEEQMRKIDWHNDIELFFVLADAEPQFTPQVEHIQEQMYRLSQDMKGADIADRLQLKYWSDATFFQDNLQQSALDYLESFPKREQYFSVALEARSAFNLLCGRAVLQNEIYPLLPDKSAWVRFDLTTKGTNGGYLAEVMPYFDRNQLALILDALPIPEDLYSQITREITRGDICHFELPDGRKILMEANPEQKTVNVYSEDMRHIQVNFRFDPDWKPNQSPELKPDALKRRPRQNIIQPGNSSHESHKFQRRK